jgi:hypothetical protein
MSIAASLLIVILAALVLFAVAGIGVLVLIKLGVITRYAFKEEPPDGGRYGLEQSKEAGDSQD